MTLAPPNVLLLCRVTRHLPKLRNVPASLTRFTTGDINCGAICLSGQASRCLYGHADTSCLVGQASNGRAGVAQISSEMGRSTAHPRRRVISGFSGLGRAAKAGTEGVLRL